MKNLYNKIIPPNEYQYRNGFTNFDIIDSLSTHNKEDLESELITKLKEENEVDTLIVTTLVYLKSKTAIPILYILLKKATGMLKLKLASLIYVLDPDKKLIDIAIIEFRSIFDEFEIIEAFYYLRLFKSNEIDSIIQEYIDNPDYLISYNAKRALSIPPFIK